MFSLLPLSDGAKSIKEKQATPFSAAIENVELMQECCPT